MTWLTRFALGLAVCLTGVSALWAEPAVAQAPDATAPAAPKAKVEFHWVVTELIPGVTDERGVRMSERDELYYLHKKAILTGADVSKVRVNKITFNAIGPNPNDQFTIYFDLTVEAKAKLAEACGENGTGLLVAVVDGRSRGFAYFQTRSMATFVPFSGFYDSKAEVDRIVEAFK
jgi:hypothetical protein